MGPSLLGALWPNLESELFPVNTLPTLQTLGDIGLILYMFSLGARLVLPLLGYRSDAINQEDANIDSNTEVPTDGDKSLTIHCE